MKFMVINGANLNMLGKREKEIYGTLSLQEIIQYTEEKARPLNVQVDWFQSNHEGEIIDKIHSLVESDYDALIINPGAYSHTSLAIFDALKILTLPILEVHLSNVYKREEFRHSMLTAKASTIIMSGLGRDSYFLAIYFQYHKRKEANVPNN